MDTPTVAAFQSPLTPIRFYSGLAVLALAIVGAAFLHGWLVNNKSDETKVKAINATALVDTKKDDSTIAQASAAQATSQKELAAQLALIAAAKTQPVTPVDYAKIDQMIASHLQSPTGAVTTATDPSTKVAMTTAPTVALRNYEYTCDGAMDQLTSCSAQLGAEKVKTAALTDKTTVQEAQIVASDQVIRGGTFKHRVWVAFKHGTCGAAGMGAGMLAGQRSTGTVGVIAGSSAYTGCELFMELKK